MGDRTQSSHLTVVPLTQDQCDFQARELMAQAEKLQAAVDRLRMQAVVLCRQVQEKRAMKEIAIVVGMDNAHISRLERYNRFVQYCAVHAPHIEISENKFRMYWVPLVDGEGLRSLGRGAKRDEYEVRVFQRIIEAINQGKPSTPSRLVQRKQNKPKTAEQLRRETDAVAALRKEFKYLYDTEAKEVILKLKKLLHADRSSYTPAFQASAAYQLEKWAKGVEKLFEEFEQYSQAS